MLSALAPTRHPDVRGAVLGRARSCSGVWGALMAAREAAEHRERAADAASRAKSQFLATMSHELRTPAERRARRPGPHQRRSDRGAAKRVSIIRRSSEGLLAVLNRSAGPIQDRGQFDGLEVVEFDLEPLVRGVAAAYESTAAKKELNFDVCEFGQGSRGSLSRQRLRARAPDYIYSLSDNAVKFTQDGGVTLSVEREGERLSSSASPSTGIIDIGERTTWPLSGRRFFQAGRHSPSAPFAGRRQLGDLQRPGEA